MLILPDQFKRISLWATSDLNTQGLQAGPAAKVSNRRVENTEPPSGGSLWTGSPASESLTPGE
jgi:hypothetical protein